MSYVDIFNIDPIQDLFSGIVPNSVMVADNESTIQGLSMKSGEILIGDTGKIPNVATLQGTPKQINIDYLMDVGNRVLRFSLPQDLDVDSSPTFTKITADTVDTKSLIIDGSEIDFTKYVTTDTDQVITGQKIFGKTLLPSIAGTIDLGTSSQYFRELRLGRGNGRVGLGLSLRVAGQAELYLHASGNTPSEITFGTNEFVRANAKWALTSYDSGRGNNFSLMRGPALTDPGATNAPWETIVDVVGSGDLASQVRFQNDTDSTSTTTGAVRFYGGVGIAKTLHAKDIVTDTLNIGGSAITPGNYVTLDTAQGITGNKAFSGQVKFSGSLEIGPSGEYDLTTMPWQYLQNVDQDLATSNSVEFKDITTSSLNVSGLTVNSVVGTGLGGRLSSLALTSTNGVTATVTDTTLTINTPQNLQRTAAPEFANLWLTGAPFSVGHALQWLNQEVKSDSNPRFASLRVIGDITTDSLTAHSNISTNTLTVNDVEVTPNKYVTTDTNQYIGGVKTFGFDLLPAGTSVNVGRSTNIFGVMYSNTMWTNHVRVGNTLLPTYQHPAPPSPVDIGSAENPFNIVYANDVKISGQSVIPTNYVNLGGPQTITGKKTFSQDVNIGSTNFGRLRLSTYGGGDSFINGGYTTDADYFLEFFVRGVKAFEIRNGYPGSGRDREVTVPGTLIVSNTGDASSTTTGSARFAGGIGVAKTLHAKDIKSDTVNTNNLTTSTLYFGPGQSILNHYEELWANNIVFYCTVGTMTPSTMSADLRLVRIGLNVTLDVRFNGTTPGAFTATNQTKIRSDIGLPQKFIGSRTPPPTTISVVNNGYSYIPGVVHLTGGNIVIWAGTLGDFFGTCHIPSFSMTYNLFLSDS